MADKKSGTKAKAGKKPEKENPQDETPEGPKYLGVNNPKYNKSYLIDELVEKVAEEGITGISAAKELRSMISEEKPDVDLEIDVCWVNIVFDDEKFYACKGEAEEI